MAEVPDQVAWRFSRAGGSVRQADDDQVTRAQAVEVEASDPGLEIGFDRPERASPLPLSPRTQTATCDDREPSARRRTARAGLPPPAGTGSVWRRGRAPAVYCWPSSAVLWIGERGLTRIGDLLADESAVGSSASVGGRARCPNALMLLILVDNIVVGVDCVLNPVFGDRLSDACLCDVEVPALRVPGVR